MVRLEAADEMRDHERMKIHHSMRAAATWLFIGASPTAPALAAEPSSVFEQLLRELEAAVEAADTTRWLEFFAEDAIAMPPTSAPVRGRPAIGVLYEPAFSGYSSLDVDYELVRADQEGGLAVLHYRGQASLVRESGERYETNTHYVDVLERQEDGGWLITLHAWSRH